jgi:hypothetical protein
MNKIDMTSAEQHFINQERISRHSDRIETEIVEKLEVYKNLFSHVRYHEWILRNSNSDILLRIDFDEKSIDHWEGDFSYILNILNDKMRERSNKLKEKYNDLVGFNELLEEK